MTAKELVQDFYKSDALIDSIMKEYLHPDVSVEWNSKGFVQLDYDGIVDISEELGGTMCDQRYGLVILYQKMI
jgi:hypothetical protein